MVILNEIRYLIFLNISNGHIIMYTVILFILNEIRFLFLYIFQMDILCIK